MARRINNRINVDSISYKRASNTKDNSESIVSIPRPKTSTHRKLISSLLVFTMLFQLIAGVFLFAPTKTANAIDASWLSGYSYRVKVPVAATASTAQTDYQMSITLHSKTGTNTAGDIYLNSHLQDTTSFNDIRFTASDSTTLKSFWIEKIEDETDGRKATVWVKLDTPATGTTDYYLYYGKTGDVSASNRDNVFTKNFGDPGLLALWHMDEGSGSTVTDSSGNSNTGSLRPTFSTNSPQWQITDSAFSTGSSLELDGTDDYISHSSIHFADAQEYSYSVWTKWNGSSPTGFVIPFGQAATLNNNIYFATGSSGRIFQYNNNGKTVTAINGSNTTSLFDGSWHMVSWTVSTDRYATFYIDGIRNGAPTLLPNSEIYYDSLGYGYNGNQFLWRGSIDEARIYNRALNANEIFRQYGYSKYASPVPIWSNPATEEQYVLGVLSQNASLAGLTNIILNGDLTGFGGESSVSVYFKYGLSADNLDQVTAMQTMNDYGSFSQNITGLSADTTYYFQAVASNGTNMVSGEVVEAKTVVLDNNYYRAIINADGTLTFTNRDNGAVILSNAPRLNLNYGSNDYSNGNSISYNFTANGELSVFTSIDDSNPYVTVTHRYELNASSPYVKYVTTLQYKQNVSVAEERFDFIVPTQNAQLMTRDLKLVDFNITQTYWSDLYTPKVVKFDNGLYFLGEDTMDAMKLQISGTDSRLSFYSDSKENHPHSFRIYGGGGATSDASGTKRSAGDVYSASVTFSVDNSVPKSLIKTRQPYGYDSILTFTNHADSEKVATVSAIAYGTEDQGSPSYGIQDIVGRGLGLTKSVFVSGQPGSLQDASFKSLTDQMYRDGVEIVGHSITTGTDNRNTVANGL